MRRQARPIALAVVLGAATGVVALAEGDATRGAEIAEEMCAQCHDIGPSGAFKTYPPSFASIAVFRADDQIYGRILFPQLHSVMPQMAGTLSSGDVANLVAYIRALEPAGVE